jgi:cell division septation protein DedD
MIEIVLPRGRRVRVGPGFDRAALEQVLEILQRQSC